MSLSRSAVLADDSTVVVPSDETDSVSGLLSATSAVVRRMIELPVHAEEGLRKKRLRVSHA